MPLKKIANKIQEVAAVDMNPFEDNAGKNGGGQFCIAASTCKHEFWLRLFGTPFTFSVGTRQHWQTM